MFYFHAFRVQYVSDLARAGVSLAMVQKLAPHSTSTLTKNIYHSVNTSELESAVEHLEYQDDPCNGS